MAHLPCFTDEAVDEGCFQAVLWQSTLRTGNAQLPAARTSTGKDKCTANVIHGQSRYLKLHVYSSSTRTWQRS